MYGYIYITTNLVNGKKYIGQKTSSRFLGEKYLGSGVLIRKAISKYGIDNFKVELLEECDSKEELDSREIYWIGYFDAVNSDMFYNLAAGGRTGSIAGSKRSSEFCKKVSVSRKGMTFSVEHRKNLSRSGKGKHIGELNGMYGKHHTIETRSKISNSVRSRMDENLREKISISTRRALQSPDVKQKMSEAGKRHILDKNPFYGKHHTEESKRRISESNKGNKHSRETKDKISESLIGNKRRLGTNQSEDTRSKISNNSKDRKCINNGITEKRVKPYELDNYLNNGWKIGRLIK